MDGKVQVSKRKPELQVKLSEQAGVAFLRVQFRRLSCGPTIHP